MLPAWRIAKFLFRVVVPTIPDIVSTISKIKNQEAEEHSQERDVERHMAELDHRLALQLDLIDQLTRRLSALQPIVRRAHTISVIALAVSLIAIALLLFRP